MKYIEPKSYTLFFINPADIGDLIDSLQNASTLHATPHTQLGLTALQINPDPTVKKKRFMIRLSKKRSYQKPNPTVKKTRDQ